MLPKERRDSGQSDFFRSRLDQIVDMNHALTKLGRQIVSRDGFILWARSSPSALKTGAFFRTSAGPIESPATALPVKQCLLIDGRASIDHGTGVWFREPVRERTVFAAQYDFAISLLLLNDAQTAVSFEAGNELEVFDKISPSTRRREW